MSDPMLEAIQGFPVSDELKAKATQLVTAAIAADLRPNRVAPVAGDLDVDIYWWVGDDYIIATVSDDDEGEGIPMSFPGRHRGCIVAEFADVPALLQRVRSEVVS